jgi:hypothetical protein
MAFLVRTLVVTGPDLDVVVDKNCLVAKNLEEKKVVGFLYDREMASLFVASLYVKDSENECKDRLFMLDAQIETVRVVDGSIVTLKDCLTSVEGRTIQITSNRGSVVWIKHGPDRQLTGLSARAVDNSTILSSRLRCKMYLLEAKDHSRVNVDTFHEFADIDKDHSSQIVHGTASRLLI